eukprot:2743272-Pleurochrysis_carterae.AAC.1
MSKAGSRPSIAPKTAPGYPAKLIRVQLPGTSSQLEPTDTRSTPSNSLTVYQSLTHTKASYTRMTTMHQLLYITLWNLSN